MKTHSEFVLLFLGLSLQITPAKAEPPVPLPGAVQRILMREVEKIESKTTAELANPASFSANAPAIRKEFLGMLGLDPLPAKGSLNAVTTGTIATDELTVEKVHFQSSPGLYVTGNLFIPKKREGKLPAILYVCGHSRMVEGGVSLGNKTGYQHHPAWFASHGFVCLAIDTIQLGEISGLHHGTHHLNLWSWNSRGYTPAGVETWNGIRALDYLQSRPEVDPERLGVTGRSGGGATSWFIAAADERIKAAVPVAGITDLRNHVIDGVVDGHCDCMFPQNTSQWDFAKIAALVAPRPLLIGNTDKDTIFPLDGVQRIHKSVAGIYSSMGASNKLGLLLCEGPHQDFQELQIGAFRWFKRFLASEPDFKAPPSQKLFYPRDLKVLTSLPKEERTSTTHEWFVPKASAENLPRDKEGWRQKAPTVIAQIRAQSFANWPPASTPVLFKHLRDEAVGSKLISHYAVGSDTNEPIDGWNGLIVSGEEKTVRALSHQLGNPRPSATSTVGSSTCPLLVRIVDHLGLTEQLQALRNSPKNATDEITLLYAPRGFSTCNETSVEPSPWSTDPKILTRIRRRFMLVGQTLDSSRVFDIAQFMNSIGTRAAGREIQVRAEGTQAANTLYASLFSENMKNLSLERLPTSHDTPEAPDYFGIQKVLDIDGVLEVARTRTVVKIGTASP